MTITRNFKLCLNAGTQNAPYINVNQYDEGEEWVFDLYTEGGQKFTPSSGAIIGIKADGNAILNSGTVNASGQVVITETQQMTAASGLAVFELLIEGETHGTANFIVNVERRPSDDAEFSDSDLSLLQQAVDSAAEIEDLLGGQDVPSVITPIISDWLDENITNPSNPPIDTSLTVAGAAADAKVVGDNISELKSAVTNLGNGIVAVDKTVNWQQGWINTSGVINSSTASQFALVPMLAGETVTIGTRNSNITIIGSTTANSVDVGDTVTVIQKTTSSNVFNTYTYTCTENINLVLCVRTSEYTLGFSKNASFMDTLNSIVDPTIVFNLPKKLYALYGYEINVYFENLVQDWTKFSWDTQGAIGQHFKRSLRLTPSDTALGDYIMRITGYGDYKSVNGYPTVVVPSVNAGSGETVSVIILGDSTTDNGTVVSKLHENFSNNVMAIATLGTRGTAPNNHEGRSGWTFNGYFTSAGSGSILNPFYNPTTQTFDADYYFTNTGVEKPDWFFINLGINDMFPYTNDTDLATGISDCLTKCDAMITSILSASPNTKIGVCLTIPPNDSQDAFGKAYSNNQYRDRYKRNNLLWVNALIKRYDERESEGIYLVPIYASLDTVYNMGLEEIPVNSRNSMTYESAIGNGGVHPATSGYWQIADVYTAFLKANV